MSDQARNRFRANVPRNRTADRVAKAVRVSIDRPGTHVFAPRRPEMACYGNVITDCPELADADDFRISARNRDKRQALGFPRRLGMSAEGGRSVDSASSETAQRPSRRRRRLVAVHCDLSPVPPSAFAPASMTASAAAAMIARIIRTSRSWRCIKSGTSPVLCVVNEQASSASSQGSRFRSPAPTLPAGA